MAPHVPPLAESGLKGFDVSAWLTEPLPDIRVADAIIGLRAKGQRWVKITYFRDLDLLHPAQARFAAELVGEIIRARARRAALWH